ncbi:MAG TPA: hypothetical protein PLL26_02480 [Candidatus Dojkabacteria bacterium]|nr:hypothetical protein [Candidatus Dojkabacteria bacterium]
MKIENINEALRVLFHELVNDGYKRRHICSLTLGAQSEPQFESFLKGNDFGIKPLQRLVQNMGYKFNIIITPEDVDSDVAKFIDDSNQEFLSTCKQLLVERLNDTNVVRSASVAKTGLLANITNELFDSITK